MQKNFQRRFIMMTAGVLLIGISIAFLRLADLGTDPYSTFNLGISSLIGIPFGTVSLTFNILTLLLIGVFARKNIGIGTLFNMVLVGYTSDFGVAVFQNWNLAPSSFFMRLLFALAGIFILSLGAALYMAPKMGVSPYDALPVILIENFKAKLSFRSARVVIDIIFSAIGFFLGATVGVSTVVTAFFMGPLMQFFLDIFNQWLKDPSENKPQQNSLKAG